MYLKPVSVFVCMLYFSIHLAQAFKGDEDIQYGLRLSENLKNTRDGISALKRVVTDIDGDLQRNHVRNDLARKRHGLEVLRRILDEMEADLVVEQKRTCKLNLGGHCATESAAAVADQWHYLNSPLSPGRKRRDTGLYKKLISGKILQ